MTEWVSLDVTLAIHNEQLAEHGGGAGIRDANLLESALARPRQLEAYGKPPPDIADLAAAYAFGTAKNYVVARAFLILNGHDITADSVSRLKVWLSLADGSISESECAAWLRANVEPLLPK
jgi:death on curing protein